MLTWAVMFRRFWVHHASFSNELTQPRTDGFMSLPLALASSATSSNQGFRRHGACGPTSHSGL